MPRLLRLKRRYAAALAVLVGRPGAGLVARPGVLDLDDVGAEVGQEGAAPGTGDDAGEIEHADAVEGEREGGHARYYPRGPRRGRRAPRERRVRAARSHPPFQQGAIGGIVVTVETEGGGVAGEGTVRDVVGEKIGSAVGGHQPVAGQRAHHVGALDGQRAGEQAILAGLRVVAAVDDASRQPRQVRGERRDDPRHPTEQDLGVGRIVLDGKGGLDRLGVVGPDQEDHGALARALGPAVDAGGELLEKTPMPGRARELGVLFLRPAEVHRIGPDHHGRVARDGAEDVVEGKLCVTLREDGELHAEQARPRLPKGPAASTKRGVPIVRAPAVGVHGDGANPAARRVDAAPRARRSDRTPAARARSRRYMPSCWPLNQPQRRAWSTRDGVVGQVREVAADERGIGDDVRARRRDPRSRRRGRAGSRRPAAGGRARARRRGRPPRPRAARDGGRDRRRRWRRGSRDDSAGTRCRSRARALRVGRCSGSSARPSRRRARATSCGSIRRTCRWSARAGDARRRGPRRARRAARPGGRRSRFPRSPPHRSRQAALAVADPFLVPGLSRSPRRSPGAGAISSAKRRSASARAITTGPRTMPMAPNVASPPMRPRSTGSVEIWARPETTRGRTILSTSDTTTMPQKTRKRAAPTRPCTASMIAAGAHTKTEPTSGTSAASEARTPKTTGDDSPVNAKLRPTSVPCTNAVSSVPRATARVTAERWPTRSALRSALSGMSRTARAAASPPSRRKKNSRNSVMTRLTRVPSASTTNERRSSRRGPGAARSPRSGARSGPARRSRASPSPPTGGTDGRAGCGGDRSAARSGSGPAVAWRLLEQRRGLVGEGDRDRRSAGPSRSTIDPEGEQDRRRPPGGRRGRGAAGG